jgi:flagellar biosynthesis regulator FlbT
MITFINGNVLKQKRKEIMIVLIAITSFFKENNVLKPFK